MVLFFPDFVRKKKDDMSDSVCGGVSSGWYIFSCIFEKDEVATNINY